MLLERIGHKNFALLRRLLSLHAAKQRVHTQNITHVNTPNYRRRELKFESSLKEAMRQGTAEAYAKIEGWVDRPNNTIVRNNGNNVDIDKEMLDMQETGKLYEICTTIYNRKSKMLSMAIQGGH